MSKVKSYFDSKTKARHRVRRQETRSKKLSHYNNYRNNTYHWYRGGYVPRPRDRSAWYSPDSEFFVNGHGYLKRYGCTKILKEGKRRTTRVLRRQLAFDEDNYELPIRNAYKKRYDLDSDLW